MEVLAIAYSCSSSLPTPSVSPSNSRVTNSRPASSVILLKEPRILSKTARARLTTLQKRHSESYLARQSAILEVQKSTDLDSALARLGDTLKVQDLNAILRHFGMLNRKKDLSQNFDWMRQNGKIDVSSYSSYIKFMGRSLSSLKALEIYNSITDTSIKNNIFICNSVLSCLVRNGNFDSGIKLFNQMKAEGLSPDVVTYSTLLAGCIKVKHRYSKALELVHELQSNGMQMDDVIYGTLLAVCASHHKWQEAERYFKQMNDEGHSPNVFHYASLLNAYSVGGNYIKAEKLVQDMKSAGLIPNKVILTTLLKVYVKGGLFEKSRELLLELESLGYAKDEMPFCLLMDGLAKARRIEEAKAVFDEMKAKQVTSDGYSYSIMISAFCRDGLLDEAKQLAKDFEAAYDRYDLVMLNTLLCAYCKSGEIDSVIQLLRKMDQLAISPDYSTFHILIKYFCKQKLHLLAYKTIMDMHSKGHQPEEELCSSLMYHLGKMRAYSEAFSVYKILRYSKRTMCKALHEKILHILIAGNLLKNAYVVVKDNAGLISSPSIKKFGTNFVKSGDINLINDVMKAIHGSGNQIDQDLFQLAVRRYIDKPEKKELFFQLLRWMPGQGYVLDSSTRNLILKNSHLLGRRYIAEILSEHHFLLKVPYKVRIRRALYTNMSSRPFSSQEAPISWRLFQEEGSSISQPALYTDANVFFDPRMYVDRDMSSSSKGFANSDQYYLCPLVQQINTSLSLNEEDRNVIVNQGGVGLASDILFHQENSRLLEEVNHEKLPDNMMNVCTLAGEKTLMVSKSFSGKSNVNAEEDSTVKKQEHNARERERRMRLSSSYLTLRSLLPNSRRSKKRWSSSTIIEKVLQYIPCLEKEIENLTHKKKEILATIKIDKKKIDENKTPDNRSESAPAVSVVEIKGVEVIIQIFMKSWSHGEDAFSSLIKKLEEQGLKILSASTVLVSDHRLSCHLHIQLEDGCDDEDNFPIFREKVLSHFGS